MNALKVTLEVSFIQIYHHISLHMPQLAYLLFFSQFPLIFLHMYQRYKRRKHKIFEMEVIS